MKYVPEVVASFPAFDVVKPRTDVLTCLPVFKDGDILSLKSSGYTRLYTIGSVVSSALKYNDDPIEEYNKAVERGHDTHWLNANASVISDMKTAKATHYEVDIGDEVLFEGIVFRVDKAANDNLKLVNTKKKTL